MDYFSKLNYAFDERFIPAIFYIESKKRKDGRWWTQKSFYSYPQLETPEPSRKPSYWVTLIALKIQKWWTGKSRGKL